MSITHLEVQYDAGACKVEKHFLKNRKALRCSGVKNKYTVYAFIHIQHTRIVGQVNLAKIYLLPDIR